ncbi:MAG: hypothetical protein ACXVEF_33945 [Polyangiales bacterium]
MGCSTTDGGSTQCPAVPSTTQVSCSAMEAGDTHEGCQGIPKDPFGSEGPTRTTERFPEGCGVVFPHENPAYPCGGQHCTCEKRPGVDGGTSLEWLCPL